MKEHGIIMSGNQPQLILEGKKTQTRRVIKLNLGFGYKLPNPTVDDRTFKSNLAKMPSLCPYGQVGDRLWVKETWADGISASTGKHYAVYKAVHGLLPGQRWISPRFMPRWASRIDLEITEVRVERLQEITDEDCQAEGCEYPQWRGSFTSWKGAYKALWDSLNAKRGYSWESNPWVWVLSFKLLNKRA